jgi:hypothetical protein
MPFDTAPRPCPRRLPPRSYNSSLHPLNQQTRVSSQAHANGFLHAEFKPIAVFM